MAHALILVDIQNDYFPGGRMELVGMTDAAINARAILDSFRASDRPRFHIQHLSIGPRATFFIDGTDGVDHHKTVAPRTDESIIKKNYPNAFRGTGLEQSLRAASVEHVVFVGAMSHMCIDATTRAAFDLGFECTVVADACATRDLVFKDNTIPALQVHNVFMAALSAPYAAVVSTEKYLKA